VLALAAVGTALSCGGEPGATRVTLDGFRGIRIGMASAQVFRKLGVAKPLVVEPDGTSAWEYLTICTGQLRGVAEFFGPDILETQPHYPATFYSAWFSSGVETPYGIRIGSTRPEVVRAYGAKLQHLGPEVVQVNYGAKLHLGPRFYLAGKPVRIHGPAHARPTIVFLFDRNTGKVRWIGYGMLGEMIAIGPGALPVKRCG
jgi:hypothetical protein